MATHRSTAGGGRAVRAAALLAAGLIDTGGVQAEAPSPMSVAQARAYFVCKTRVSFTPEHGTQVSYLNSSGTVLLWYPGNSVVVRGSWKIEEGLRSAAASLCFQYGANTYNPVTRERGGRWSCLPAHLWVRTTVDRSDGDVFGLARRDAPPFVLSREPTNIAHLQARIPALPEQRARVP